MKSMSSKQGKTILGLIAVLLALAVPVASVSAAADAYPSKPVRVIVNMAPGGSNDLVARIFAEKLTERLGKSVVVDNRPGAGGVIGTEMAARAVPDGYTIMSTAGQHTLMAPLNEKLTFDPLKSFLPIARMGSGPNVLVVHPSLPVNSVKELIALAKQKPGQLIIPSSGAGTVFHVSIESFKAMAGIDLKVVHFKGGGPALIDVLGGHSQVFISSLLAALPHIKSGKLRALGTGGTKRSSLLPDVPTIAEAGGIPGYTTMNWWGMFAPAGTPVPVITRLTNEIKAIVSTDDMKKRLLNDGIEAEYMGPAEFAAFLEAEQANWVKIVKKANIKLED
jgi:tripartite-type tricarboxylate transporter receptor subunit TctC